MFEQILRALLDEGKAARFRASGTSMAPAIRNGEEVVVERGGPLRKGDVVLFREPASQRMLAHRIVAIGPDGVLLRGDAAETCEGPVDPSMIVGRVIGVDRDGKVHPLDTFRIRLHLLARRVRMGLGIRRAVRRER